MPLKPAAPMELHPSIPPRPGRRWLAPLVGWTLAAGCTAPAAGGLAGDAAGSGAPAGAIASGSSALAEADAREHQDEQDTLVDRVQERISARVVRTAHWVDTFLANERALVEENRTRLAVRLDFFGADDGSSSLGAGVDARVSLPNTEERLQLLLRRDRDEERRGLRDGFEEPVGSRPEGAEREDLSLALRYFAAATDRDNFQLDLGVRFDGSRPDPFAGIRFRHEEPHGRWLGRVTERLRYYSLEGWESRTWLDLERPLGQGRLLRATTSGSWFQEEEGYFYGQRLAFHQRLRSRALLTTEASAAFRTRPVHELESFRIRAAWSRRLAREWLLVEAAPQVVWREEDDFEAVAGLLLRLEISFGADP